MVDATIADSLVLGVAAAQAGNRLLANIHLNDAVRQSPDDARAWLWLAWLAESPQAALMSLRQALQLAPGDELALAGLRWAEALVAYELDAESSTPDPGEPAHDEAFFQSVDAGLSAEQDGETESQAESTLGQLQAGEECVLANEQPDRSDVEAAASQDQASDPASDELALADATTGGSISASLDEVEEQVAQELNADSFVSSDEPPPIPTQAFEQSLEQSSIDEPEAPNETPAPHEDTLEPGAAFVENLEVDTTPESVAVETTVDEPLEDESETAEDPEDRSRAESAEDVVGWQACSRADAEPVDVTLAGAASSDAAEETAGEFPAEVEDSTFADLVEAMAEEAPEADSEPAPEVMSDVYKDDACEDDPCEEAAAALDEPMVSTQDAVNYLYHADDWEQLADNLHNSDDESNDVVEVVVDLPPETESTPNAMEAESLPCGESSGDVSCGDSLADGACSDNAICDKPTCDEGVFDEHDFAETDADAAPQPPWRQVLETFEPEASTILAEQQESAEAAPGDAEFAVDDQADDADEIPVPAPEPPELVEAVGAGESAQDEAKPCAAARAANLVLVVDSSPTVRKLVRLVLSKRGYEVLGLGVSEAPLDEIAARPPGLFLVDIQMPGLDGYQFCKLLRKREELREIPILMLSGKDGLFDKLRGKLVGCNDYLNKPLDPDVLASKVESYLPTSAARG